MAGQVQVIRRQGREYVVLPRTEYEKLLALTEKIVVLAEKLSSSLAEGEENDALPG